ncbi:MAG: glutathione peroxidase [Acidobacteriota bacterium]|nr:glutathione peroxidase [Acidobacteriota bacterium]
MRVAVLLIPFEVVAFTPCIRRTGWKDVVRGRVGVWWEEEMKPGISVFVAGTLISALGIVGCSDAGTASETTTKEVTMTAPEAMIGHTAGIVDHTVRSIEGDTVDLRGYRGRPMLIVNTASKCGYTRQYDTLQKLYEKFGDRGFVIVGFPSNDFGNQEPGTHEEIANFCRLNYGVTFPMMEKVHTKGPEQAPIYRTLTTESGQSMRGEIKWNFTKFLINGDGEVVARFEPNIDPMDDAIVDTVEALLPAES